MRVSHFMEAALGHPEFGYYTAREPFGRAGDFITAPEISQMFGELLGAWLAAHWRVINSPAPVHVAELGPGRGALMADALRAARAQPGFIDAASLHLIETSPRLRAQQAEAVAGALAGAPAGAGADKNRIHWARDVSQIPPGLLLLLANEFFDALPIRQFICENGAWRERRVCLNNAGELAFTWGPPSPAPPAALPPALRAAAMAQPGAIVEVSPAALRAVHTIAARLAVHGGAALIIDYGHARSGAGETLQAVRAHAFQHPLSRPGETDLTAHVDFQAMAETARGAGARVFGPVGQGAFLESLGISARAAALAENATPGQRAEIESAHARLTGAGAGQMGALFKVLCLTGPNDPPPPGFGGQRS
ncbi:MAG: class I SAM-dependent methyltransferase [Rhodospirillales bacterium]